MPAPIDPARLRDAAELYSSGMSLQRIAQELGVSKRTVQRHLDAAGVERRPVGARRLRGLDDQAVTLYVELEWSLERIAAHYGVAVSTARRELLERGVRMRQRGPSTAGAEKISAVQRERPRGPLAPDVCAKIAVSLQRFWGSASSLPARRERSARMAGWWTTGTAAPASLFAIDRHRVDRTPGGRARSRWLGRWAGRKAGRRGGRPRTVISEAKRAEILHWHNRGWGRPAIVDMVELPDRAVRNVLSAERPV
jgi:transposase